MAEFRNIRLWDLNPVPTPPRPPINSRPYGGVISSNAPCPIPHCAGSPIDMSSSIPSECDQCVTECNIENCRLSTEEPQCTDRCVVIPCESPCLDSCGACTSCVSSLCESDQCPSFGKLLHSSTNIPYIQSSYTSLSIAQPHSRAQLPDWNNATLSRELDALVCACHTQSLPHSFDCYTCDPSLLSVHKHPSCHHRQRPPTQPSVSAPMSIPDSPVSLLLSPMLTSTSSSRSSPDPSQAAEVSLQPADARTSGRESQCIPEKTFCLWAGCGRPFSSSQNLITHFNKAHLLLPLAQEDFLLQRPPSHRQLPTSDDKPFVAQDSNPFSCLWDNCNTYPTPSQVSGPSTGNVTDIAKGLLARHVQQDHLRIPVSRLFKPNGPTNVTSEGGQQFIDTAHTSPTNISTPPPNSTSPRAGTSTSAADSASIPSQYLCKWHSCTLAGVPYSSAAELTTHITNTHVGVGNSRYHCLWEGCTRNGDSGFCSKQKILRHIQSHTGHRPFKCKICEQFFSEAATLQQHMRRHTKERPYICDFPGCNKAFAITGALTIHRRVHSGSKPFKCTYCDRSFSESSNLSKHVRTHTGDRPYACSFSGCEKRFARPDQVSRHKNVHTKKKQGELREGEGNAGNEVMVAGS